jgi:hypothetical protein
MVQFLPMPADGTIDTTLMLDTRHIGSDLGLLG